MSIFDDDAWAGWSNIGTFCDPDRLCDTMTQLAQEMDFVPTFPDRGDTLLQEAIAFAGVEILIHMRIDAGYRRRLQIRVPDKTKIDPRFFDFWERLENTKPPLVDGGPGREDRDAWIATYGQPPASGEPAVIVDPARIDQAPRNPDADSQNVPAGPPAPTVLAHGEMSQELQEIFVLARHKTGNGKKLMSFREFAQRTIQELLNRWVASPDRAKEFLQRDYYRLGVVHKRDGAMPKIFLGGLDVITVGDFCEKDALLNHEKIYFQMHPELRPK